MKPPSREASLKSLQPGRLLMVCTQTKTDIPGPSRRTRPGNTGTTWAGRLVAIAFTLCLPISASADIVSGRVYDPGGSVLPNTTFVVEAGKGEAVKFKTDESGNFSVYLEPGGTWDILSLAAQPPPVVEVSVTLTPMRLVT